MGKKGRRSAKAAGSSGGDDKSTTKKKVGPGKARRERAAALRDIMARLDTLADKLEEEPREKDMDLFDKVEDQGDCPICFVPMPRSGRESLYYPCCGKIVCDGCTYSSFLLCRRTKQVPLCPFCRADTTDLSQADTTDVSQTMRRVERGDAEAMLLLAHRFKDGQAKETPKDEIAALQNYLKAAELGNAQSLSILSRILLLDSDKFGLQKEQNLGIRLATAGAKQGNLNSYVMLGMGEQMRDNQEQATQYPYCRLYTRLE